MKSITWVMTGMWVTLLVAPVATKAEVLARYHFNGRTEYGQRTKRPHDSFAPYNGSHYVPNVASGETGPTLENPGGGGYADFYQSYYNNSGSVASTNRETLEMAQHHTAYTDRYRTAAGAGMVPLTGSFSWEAIASVSYLAGVTTGGRSNVAWLITSNWRENINTPETPDYRGRGVSFRLDNYSATAGTYEALFTIVHNIFGHATSAMATNLNVNQYYHFACVYDAAASLMRLYVDEALVDSKTVVSYSQTNDVGICGWNASQVTTINPGSIRGFIDALSFTDDVRRPYAFDLIPPRGTVILVQ